MEDTHVTPGADATAASWSSFEGLEDFSLEEADTLRRAQAAEQVADQISPGKRPLILVSPCWAPAEGPRKPSNEYVGDVFLEAIVGAGGMPIVMPISCDERLIRAYVDMCDGIAIPGGYGPDPTLWGEEPSEDKGLSSPRDALEIPLIRAAIEADKPLLCICRGEQLLTHVCGGTVSRDLVSVPCPLAEHWTHWGIHWEPAHEVTVEPCTLLSRCIGGARRIRVNSNHRQCVLTPGDDLRVVAHATDGVIEAVEHPGKRFCLGVQWHPEYSWTTNPPDAGIWRAFVRAAAGLDGASAPSDGIRAVGDPGTFMSVGKGAWAVDAEQYDAVPSMSSAL